MAKIVTLNTLIEQYNATLPAGTYDHTGPVKIISHPSVPGDKMFILAADGVWVNQLPKETSAEVAMAHEAEPVVPRKPVCGHCHERKASRRVDMFCGGNFYKHEAAATADIDYNLETEADAIMAREVKRSLREWPICKVSGNEIPLVFSWLIDQTDFIDDMNTRIAEFHCPHCYQDE